jgi:hypothetical protein
MTQAIKDFAERACKRTRIQSYQEKRNFLVKMDLKTKAFTSFLVAGAFIMLVCNIWILSTTTYNGIDIGIGR